MMPRLIRTVEEFSDQGEVWNRRLEESGRATLFLSHEWLTAWWRNLGPERGAHILIFEEDGAWLGAAPLVREGDAIGFMASREVSDYADFLYPPGGGDAFCREFLSCLTEGSPAVDRILLMNIPEDSPTLHAMPGTAEAFGFACVRKESDVVPGLRVSAGYSGYLSDLTRKRRHELKRKLKRTETLPGFRLEHVSASQAMPAAVDRFIRLHRESSASKGRFWETRGVSGFFRELALRFAERGWAEMIFLHSADRLAAALLFFLSSRRLSLYNVAFDPAFAEYSPGFYLFDTALRRAFEKGIEYVDFLRGGEKYKYDLGAGDRVIYDLRLSPLEGRA